MKLLQDTNKGQIRSESLGTLRRVRSRFPSDLQTFTYQDPVKSRCPSTGRRVGSPVVNLRRVKGLQCRVSSGTTDVVVGTVTLGYNRNRERKSENVEGQGVRKEPYSKDVGTERE